MAAFLQFDIRIVHVGREQPVRLGFGSFEYVLADRFAIDCIPDCLTHRGFAYRAVRFAAVGDNHFRIHGFAANKLIGSGVNQLIHRLHIDAVAPDHR